MTTPVEQVKAKEEIISLEFEKGVPVELNSVRKSPLVLLQELNELGRKHDIRVCDIIESRLVGMKIRGIYEAPATAVIF
jgi:argininosuccinate synthase